MYFWENTIVAKFGEAWDFLRHLALFMSALFDALPDWAQAALNVVLFVALLGIMASHSFAFHKCRNEWKKNPKNELAFSYFCGTGPLQRKLGYKEAHRLLRDRRWFPASFAGLCYRLNHFVHESRILIFGCTLLYLPLVVLGFIEMVFRVAVGTVWLLAASLAHRMILFGLRWVSYVLIPVWQTADKASRIVQHCPHCYETFDLPVFVCPKCGRKHRQLIPGRSGILVARCECGRFLPSTLFTGRSSLQAVCPACGWRLFAPNARPFSIQLIGGNSSGKTAYLAAFSHQYLEKTAGIKDLSISGEPRHYFDALEKIYRNGLSIPSSSTAATPYSFVHRFKRKAKDNLVIYDIPDEAILNRTYERNPRNLGFSDGIIIIVDPLGIAAAREECQRSGDEGALAGHSTDDIEELIIAFVQLFASITGQTSSKLDSTPVSIVINKTDIKAVKREVGLPKIKAAFGSEPGTYSNDISIARDEICRAYLSKLGLDNALNNLDGAFSNVRYFPVSSIGHAGESGKGFAPVGVLAPVAWIAEEAGAGISQILREAENSAGTLDSERVPKQAGMS